MQSSLLNADKAHNQKSKFHAARVIDGGKTLDRTHLLEGERYAWITHAGETYLLQITKSNKLLLTK
jgi:hemin uptake protein HemP